MENPISEAEAQPQQTVHTETNPPDQDLVKLCQDYSSYLEFPELRNQQVWLYS